MFCPICGTQNEEGARFCAKCGAELPRMAAPTRASHLDTNGDGIPDVLEPTTVSAPPTTVMATPTTVMAPPTTVMAPPTSSTVFFATARLIPLPPKRAVVLSSSRSNTVNTFGRKSLSMPIPVSLMQNFSVDCFSKAAVFSIVNVTDPGASVNFTALLRILISTSLSLVSSPM